MCPALDVSFAKTVSPSAFDRYMHISSACLVSRSILVTLALVFAALVAGATASARALSTDQSIPVVMDDRGVHTDGTAYITERPHGPGVFVQPGPIALPAVHGTVLRGHTHVATDLLSFSSGSVPFSQGGVPAGEILRLDHEGGHRHRWLQTYRC